MVCIVSSTNLTSALNINLRIVLHMTVLTATIDRTLDESVSTDRYYGLSSQAKRLDILHVIVNIIIAEGCLIIVLFDITDGHTPRSLCNMPASLSRRITFVGQGTLTGTKDVTCEIGLIRRGIMHLHIVGTDLGIALNYDGTISTSIVC